MTTTMSDKVYQLTRERDRLRDQLAEKERELQQANSAMDNLARKLTDTEREIEAWQARVKIAEWTEDRFREAAFEALEEAENAERALREENERLQRDLEHERGLRSSYQDKYNTWVVPEIEAAERRAAHYREAAGEREDVPAHSCAVCGCHERDAVTVPPRRKG